MPFRSKRHKDQIRILSNIDADRAKSFTHAYNLKRYKIQSESSFVFFRQQYLLFQSYALLKPIWKEKKQIYRHKNWVKGIIPRIQILVIEDYVASSGYRGLRYCLSCSALKVKSCLGLSKTAFHYPIRFFVKDIALLQEAVLMRCYLMISTGIAIHSRTKYVG